MFECLHQVSWNFPESENQAEPELMFKEDFHANLDPNLPKAIFLEEYQC